MLKKSLNADISINNGFWRLIQSYSGPTKSGSGPKNNVFLAKKTGSGKDKASLLIEIIRYGVKKFKNFDGFYCLK